MVGQGCSIETWLLADFRGVIIKGSEALKKGAEAPSGGRAIPTQLPSPRSFLKLRGANNVHQEVVSYIEKDTGFYVQKTCVASSKLLNLYEPPFCHL